MKKTTFLAFFLVAILVLILAGCSTQRAWTYKAEPPVSKAPMINKSVAVSPLSDGRENVNRNGLLMYLIPLMPFGWQDLKTPEGVQMHINSGLWQFKPTEDFAKAIAEELNNSGIFKEAFFTNRPSEGDLLFKGEIKSTDYDGKMITYCLSIEGPLLWLIGLPATYIENNLGLSLQLVDSKANEVLWQGTYKKTEGHTSWIYALQPDFLYDRLLKEIMKEVLPSLKNKLAKPQLTVPEKPVTLTPITPSPGTTKILRWDFSDVKSAPGSNYSSIATVRKGDKLTIMEQSGEWVRVRLGNGQEGWIRSEVFN